MYGGQVFGGQGAGDGIALGMGGADHPLKLDSRKPTKPLEQFMLQEGRFAMLARSDPARAKQLMKSAQKDADARWQLYEQVAGVHRVVNEEGHAVSHAAVGAAGAAARGCLASPAVACDVDPTASRCRSG